MPVASCWVVEPADGKAAALKGAVSACDAPTASAAGSTVEAGDAARAAGAAAWNARDSTPADGEMLPVASCWVVEPAAGEVAAPRGAVNSGAARAASAAGSVTGAAPVAEWEAPCATGQDVGEMLPVASSSAKGPSGGEAAWLADAAGANDTGAR